MKMIEPSAALVRNGSRSAGFVSAGPLVNWIVVPSSLGSTVANVVLPRPGGPSNRMCDSGSFSFLQALRTMPSRCTTSRWRSSSPAASPWTIACLTIPLRLLENRLDDLLHRSEGLAADQDLV